jgi:DNA-binding response OmpR family regulator
MAYTKTVLVVEDEHFISELYARALRKAGYEVTIMLSGEDGLAAAMTNNYDLILLDLLIPGISGIDALHQLRGGVKPAVRSKIIITTNLDQDESNRADLEKLADGYLIKAEMTPNQLVEIVNDMFKTDSTPSQS